MRVLLPICILNISGALEADLESGGDPVEWCKKNGVFIEHQEGLFDEEDEDFKLDAKYAPNFKCPPPVNKGWGQDTILASDPVAVPLPGSSDVFLPMYRRQLFGKKSPSFAFIQLHGAFLDGDYYFRQAVRAVPLVVNNRRRKTRGKTAVVVAPVFSNWNCTKATWLGKHSSKSSMQATTPIWNDKMWVNGIKAHHVGDWRGISTYTALDIVVDWLESKYPKLEKITLMGFSAGAKMALRWTVTSKYGLDGTTPKGTPFQTIIGSPSSELYLNDMRPAGSCVKVTDTGARFYCKHYKKPTGRHGSATAQCAGTYDSYPNGLEGINEVMHVDYVGNATPADLRKRFATKNMWIGVGDRDIVTCNVGGCQRTCEAMATGSSRLQRALNFVHHLEDAIPGYKPKYQVFSGGHAYFHMLCGDTRRPETKASYFVNAWHDGVSAKDKFECSMHIVPNTGLSGNIISQKEAGSKEECCDYCGSVATCKGWTYAYKWSTCQLLSDVQGQWPTEDFCGGMMDEKDLLAIQKSRNGSAMSLMV